jgi:hypothetical protein
MAEATGRTLTLLTTAGLSNRLRVLLSGMTIAEATGRHFRMVWPQTSECAATFPELFSTPWPVETPTEQTWQVEQHFHLRGHNEHDLLTAETPDLYIHTYHSLLRPQQFPAHKVLYPRMAELLTILQPTDEIEARIAAFQANAFRPQMIGVHLRRGDFHLYQPGLMHNTDSAIRAVDGYLTQYPDAGILLCTDDGALNQYSGRPTSLEGIRAKFMQRYGERVVSTTPRSLDRRDPVATHDALVDLWLLRRTDCFVGTVGSSFSGIALLGRTIPKTICESRHPLRHLTPMLYWLRGDQSLKWLARTYWRLIRPRVVK